MSKVQDQPFYMKLTVEDRIKLIGEIWDSLPAQADSMPLTAQQEQELLRREEEARLHPEKWLSEEEANRRIDEHLRKRSSR